MNELQNNQNETYSNFSLDSEQNQFYLNLANKYNNCNDMPNNLVKEHGQINYGQP